MPPTDVAAGLGGIGETRRWGRSEWAWTLVPVVLAVGPVLIHQLSGRLDPDWPALALPVLILLVAFRFSPIRSLVLLGLFSLFVDTITLGAGTTVKSTDEVVVVLLSIATLAKRRSAIALHVRLLREACVVLFVLAACASSVVNHVAPATWLPGLLLVGKSVAVFYVALVHDARTEDFQWAGRVTLVIACVVLGAGLLETFYPDPFVRAGLPPWSGRVGLPAINGLFYHPQLFGWFCGFAALFLYAHHVAFRRRAFLVLATLFSIGTILSARRRAILGVLGGIGAGVVSDAASSSRNLGTMVRRWAPSSVSIVLLGVVFFPALTGLVNLTVSTYLPPGGTQVGPGQITPAEAAGTPARIALLNGSLSIARDHFPLGAGLGRYGSWMSRQNYSSVYQEYGLDRVPGLSPQFPDFITDTFWPQVLGETGVIGTAAFFGFLVFVGLQLLNVVRRMNGPPAMTAYLLGSLLVFSQAGVESLASPIYNSPSQAYLVMLAAGASLSWAASRAHDEVAEPADSAPTDAVVASPRYPAAGPAIDAV